MDPSRVNTAAWSARDYVRRSWLYTPEKMLPLAEEGSDPGKEHPQPEATGTKNLETGETSLETGETSLETGQTSLETGETNNKPRTPLPTSRPQKELIPDKETKTTTVRAKKRTVAKKSKKSSKTGKKKCLATKEIEEQAKPLEKDA
jgi:hypothetical protein